MRKSLILLLALVLFLLPVLLRLVQGNTLPPGDEPYYHLRISQLLARQGFVESDMMAYEGRTIFWSPLHVLLAGAVSIAPWKLVMLLIPLLLALGSVLLLMLFLKNAGLPSPTIYGISFVFVLSPVTLFLSTHLVPASAAVFLLLLGLVCLQRQWVAFATLVFALQALLGIIPALVALAALWGYARITRRDVRLPWIVAFVLFIVIHLPRLVTVPLQIPAFVQLGGIQTVLSDFGALIGLSTFAALLAVLGLVSIWRHKGQYYPVYLLLLAVLLATFWFHPFIYYTNLLVAVLAGIALKDIYSLRWKLSSIKSLTLLVLACGLLFSTIANVMLQVSEQPTPSLVEGLDWMRSNTPEQSRVFSHFSKGHWITFFAERPVLMDGVWDGARNVEGLSMVSEILFASTEFDRSAKHFDMQNIKYVAIMPDFFEGKVWQKPGRGLNYLITNSESFKRRFSGDNVEIWEYLPASAR